MDKVSRSHFLNSLVVLQTGNITQQASGKPLDFSFSDLTEIAQLKKAPCRTGWRKKYIDVDEEEEIKKVTD